MKDNTLTEGVDDVERESSDRGASSVVDFVAGDRGIPSVNRARSLQSRISNLLALGLMSTLGVGFLAWYYTQSFAQRARAQEQAKSAAREKAEGEMMLPQLGRIDSPPVTPIERVLGPEPELPASFAEGSSASDEEREAYVRYAHPTKVEDPARTRRLAGPAFVSSEADRASASEQRTAAQGSSAHGGVGGFESWLVPSVVPAASASVLPTQRLLLPKGSFLDCTLETAIDSTLPGMTTCVMASDAFSADGSVVLLERGTKLVGETRGEVKQGAARVFVLWTQARTPEGVIVPLASPGTDELGRSGLPGEVDRHFFERFGAAILVSVIDGAIQREVQSSRDGGTVIYSPSTSRDILTEVLRSTVNIPPTVRKDHGDRIQVLVARDLDFRSVYQLRLQGRAG